MSRDKFHMLSVPVSKMSKILQSDTCIQTLAYVVKCYNWNKVERQNSEWYDFVSNNARWNELLHVKTPSLSELHKIHAKVKARWPHITFQRLHGKFSMRRGYVYEQQVLNTLKRTHPDIHKPEPKRMWVHDINLSPLTDKTCARPWRLIGHADGLTRTCVFDIKVRQKKQKCPTFWEKIQLYFYMKLYNRRRAKLVSFYAGNIRTDQYTLEDLRPVVHKEASYKAMKVAQNILDYGRKGFYDFCFVQNKGVTPFVGEPERPLPTLAQEE